MSPRRSALAASENIALRLRRRRDGSVALCDERGAVASDRLAFPAKHLFLYEWLATGGAGVATFTGEQIRIELVNATAVYDVGERTAVGIEATLVETELRSAPPVDEAEAKRLAAEQEG